METPIIAALAAAIGAVVGASLAAIFNFRAHRESLAQRSREHLVAQAYEAATAEWKTGLEFLTKRYPNRDFVAATYPSYLVYHLTLVQLLVDRQGIERLDEQSIAYALEQAKRLSLVERNTDGFAGAENK